MNGLSEHGGDPDHHSVGGVGFGPVGDTDSPSLKNAFGRSTWCSRSCWSIPCLRASERRANVPKRREKRAPEVVTDGVEAAVREEAEDMPMSV